jgi:hypothetical protein
MEFWEILGESVERVGRVKDKRGEKNWTWNRRKLRKTAADLYPLYFNDSTAF